MNISCRIANADTQCGRITNPPEREDWISKTSFEFYKRENGILKHFDPDIVFTSNPNIQYKYGRLYIEYDKNGKRKEREMYEDSNDIVIYNHLRNH